MSETRSTAFPGVQTYRNALKKYLESRKDPAAQPAALAYLSALASIAEKSPEIAWSIVKELVDQRSNLKLIASENYSSPAVQLAMGNLLTDKYAEGYSQHRFYAGCDNVDRIETAAVEAAKKLFNAEHAYVQPHSGADANLIAYWAILETRVEKPALKKFGEDVNVNSLTREDWETIRKNLGNQKLLGMDYYSGGHLTHGYRHNVSARMFDAYTYGVDRETKLIDYKTIEKQAKEIRPLILLAGYSAYSRRINFRKLREIADSVGAVFMVDMAHFAGLVAGGVFEGDENPVAHAQVVTTTTHKTLRGPRGGMILCTEEFKEAVDGGCPLVIGGPLPQILAAKAVAFSEALEPSFRDYAKKIVENAQALADGYMKNGITVLTGGTDNHLMLVDVTPFGLTGRQAESALRECGITLNRNSLPYDANGPWYTSGLRFGTPALTTLGMGKTEMGEIAKIVKDVLAATKPAVGKSGEPGKAKYVLDKKIVERSRERVRDLLSKYALYPEIDVSGITAGE